MVSAPDTRIPRCVDCKHFLGGTDRLCIHPALPPHPIYHRVIAEDALRERTRGDCGMYGKLFEARQPAAMGKRVSIAIALLIAFWIAVIVIGVVIA